MSALRFLLIRQLRRVLRQAYLLVGYQPDNKTLSERLYLVYLVLILGSFGLFMLFWVVVTAGNALAVFHLPLALFQALSFLILGGWLALLPAQAAQHSYDLHRFELADLTFLSQTPVNPGLIALVWWLRSLWSYFTPLFVLACGILAATVSYLNHGNDLVAVAVGSLAGLLILVLNSALRWVLGLLRYYPGVTFNKWLGYGITLVILVVLFLPWEGIRWVLGLVSLESWLLVGRTANENGFLTGLALLGLAGLSGLMGGAVYLVGRRTLLAPAFEEGQLGGQFRLTSRTNSAAKDEADLLYHLGRQMQSGRFKSRSRRLQNGGLSGVVGAVLYREWLRLKRRPRITGLGAAFLLVSVGCGDALALANLSSTPGVSVSLLFQATYFANLGLLRLGIRPLRRELMHLDLMINWPCSRLRLLANQLGLGLWLPLLSGEVALLVNGLLSSSSGLWWVWLGLWPLVVVMTGLLALIQIQRQLPKWAANLENLPDIGSGTVLLVGSVWLVIVLQGPLIGLLVCGLALIAAGFWLYQLTGGQAI